MSTAGPKCGIWLFPDVAATELVRAAAEAESAGLDEFWLGDEGPQREPLTVLAAAATATTTLRLGVAVTNPYVRHPVATAAAAMTIQELSNGRLVLGIGAGGELSLGPLGLRREQPVRRTEDAIRLFRAASAGRRTEGYSPGAKPFTTELPIYVGARGERMNRLASASADGVFLGGVATGVLPTVIGWARAERAVDIALYLNASVDASAREESRPRLIYALLDAPVAFRKDAGVELAALQEAADELQAGNEMPARALITDELLDQLTLPPEPTAAGRMLARLARTHAATSVGLAMLTADLDRAIDFAAATAAVLQRESL